MTRRLMIDGADLTDHSLELRDDAWGWCYRLKVRRRRA